MFNVKIMFFYIIAANNLWPIFYHERFHGNREVGSSIVICCQTQLTDFKTAIWRVVQEDFTITFWS